MFGLPLLGPTEGRKSARIRPWQVWACEAACFREKLDLQDHSVLPFGMYLGRPLGGPLHFWWLLDGGDSV